MTADPVSPLRPSRRRPQRSGTGKVAHLLPMFGVIEEDDHGTWSARTFGRVELGNYRHRAEAEESLLVFAVLGGMPCTH